MNDAQRAVRNLSEAMDRAAKWYSEVEAEVDAMAGEINAPNELLKRAIDAADQLDCGRRHDDHEEIKNALDELDKIRQELPA